MRPSRIISGGQTGADRAALDVAIHLGIPFGGYAPRSWLTEDGTLPKLYRAPNRRDGSGLVIPTGDLGAEHTHANYYRERTRLNVESCDAALLLYWEKITPGTKLTMRLLGETGKTYAVRNVTEAFYTYEHVGFIEEITFRIRDAKGGTLLVAGTRESKAPGIYAYAYTVLREALR